MTAAPAPHLVGGPLDLLLELALPVVLFAVLWWGSARAERKKARKDKDGPEARR